MLQGPKNPLLVRGAFLFEMDGLNFLYLINTSISLPEIQALEKEKASLQVYKELE